MKHLWHCKTKSTHCFCITQTTQIADRQHEKCIASECVLSGGSQTSIGSCGWLGVFCSKCSSQRYTNRLLRAILHIHVHNQKPHAEHSHVAFCTICIWQDQMAIDQQCLSSAGPFFWTVAVAFTWLKWNFGGVNCCWNEFCGSTGFSGFLHSCAFIWTLFTQIWTLQADWLEAASPWAFLSQNLNICSSIATRKFSDMCRMRDQPCQFETFTSLAF